MLRLWRLQGVGFGFPWLVAAAAVAVTPLPPGWSLLAVAAAVAASVFGWWWASRRFARFGYELSDETLRVRDGVVVHTDSVMPLFRVQHIDIDQGPLERWLDLATLTVHTAAPAADATLPGVATADVSAVRDEILRASRQAAARLGLEDESDAV